MIFMIIQEFIINAPDVHMDQIQNHAGLTHKMIKAVLFQGKCSIMPKKLTEITISREALMTDA